MMMTTQISIIIPVYNSAGTIERCIDSILKQDFTDYEVILVNDGSTDNSLEVMWQQAELDPRVIAIDKQHTGVSDTRNFALDRVRGKYICYIDADDYVEPNYLSAMYAYRYCDMVISGYYVDVMQKKGKLIRRESQMMPLTGMFDISQGCDDIFELFRMGKIHINCNKLLHLDIIRANNIRYQSYPVNEDYMFMIEYLKHAKTIYATEAFTYHWVRVEGQKTGVDSIPKNLLEIYLEAHSKTCTLFRDKTLVDRIFYYTFEFVVRKYMAATENESLSRIECKTFLNRMFSEPQVKACWSAHQPSGIGERIMMKLLNLKLFGLYQRLFVK